MENDNLYFGKDLEAMSFARNYHQWIIEELMPYIGEEVAEVGAGVGNFSDYLLKSTAKSITAFEPSDNMYPSLENKFSDSSVVNTVNAFFEDKVEDCVEKFDSVCYVNVLEHVEHHCDALKAAYKSLRPGGHVLIFVPALSFLYSNLDKDLGHYRRYSKAGLIDVAESAGFSVKKVHYCDIVGIIPWYIVFVLMKKTMVGSSVSTYDSWVVPVVKKLEQMIRPFIGKNLMLVGEKK